MIDQAELRQLLQAIVADAATRGDSLAAVGQTLAEIIGPTRKPLTRQYVQMLAAGKARMTEEIAGAVLTMGALLDGASSLQAHARRVDVQLWTLNPLPANAIITDPAHPCRLPGCARMIIGRRAYCDDECKREARRRRRLSAYHDHKIK